MTMNELVDEMLANLNSIDFDYYRSEFGYSEWETIRRVKLETHEGWAKKGINVEFSPTSTYLKCENETKIISTNELKKMFMNQRRQVQLALF